MKNTLMTAVLALLLTIPVIGEDVWFTWSKNPPQELVSSYKIEYLKLPAITNWTFLTTVPPTTNVAVIKGLQGGFTYKFRIFSVNSLGTGTNESNIIQIPTNSPTVVRDFSITNSPTAR